MLTAIVSDLNKIKEPAHSGDVGFDLIADSDPRVIHDEYGDILYIEYSTGLKIQPPANHYTLVFPRSSLSNYSLVLANSVGVIDESYRGEISVRFRYTGRQPEKKLEGHIPYESPINIYKKGDKIAQLVFVPAVIPVLKEGDMSETTRQGGGYGSTGN